MPGLCYGGNAAPVLVDRSHRLLTHNQYLRALAALVENAPVGMCVLTRQGVYLVVNRTLAALNGLPVEAHIGRTVAEIIPDVWARAKESIERALQTSTPVVDMLVEGETALAPGEVRQYLESWFPILTDEVGEAFVAIVVREVTAERRMTHELQEADQRKDAFLATLAHELRNPLAPLANCVPLVRGLADPAASRVADVIERQLNMLTRLVDDLNDASRIRSGKLELRWEDVDLVEAVRDALAAASVDASARQHTLSHVLTQQPMGIRGDAVRLRQLFGNLLKNACKFTPPHGSIHLQLACTEQTAVVSIADTGIGIPADKLRSIFARLSQGNAPREMQSQGLGIGLWLAREIAELHGGSIEAFSDGPGCGSRFEVKLPLREKR